MQNKDNNSSCTPQQLDSFTRLDVVEGARRHEGGGGGGVLHALLAPPELPLRLDARVHRQVVDVAVCISRVIKTLEQ
jgi:hypothetical protein